MLCFGVASNGQLGLGSNPAGFIATPQRNKFFDDKTCIQVACTLTHSCFLMDDGNVYSCGNNEYSQLGREGRNYVPGTGFSQQKSFLKDNGTVYSFGANNVGQLGLGNTIDCWRPCPLLSLRGVPICHIACGAHHSIIISKSATVFTCGLNTSGQLGIGDTDPRFYPTNVKALQYQKVTYASCGEKHTVVITADGGVFSFGSGKHGQLGHNSTIDELLPRKITELMGSEVSQIACGRSHTVVFVPNAGQILTFGLACAGGVDTQLTSFVTIPQKLQYPFVSYRKMKQFQRQMSDHSVQQIQRPVDYRVYNLNRPTLELTLDFARGLCHASKSKDTLRDAERKMSRLFNTEACINGSFLALSDVHYRTSSNNPGIDIDSVIAIMEKLRTCDQTIQNLLLEHIQSIIGSLPETAPCFEALRVYLVLPFCHLFENDDALETITGPFALAMTKLKEKADGKVLDYWIQHIGRVCVERIIEIYKPLVVKIISINLSHMPAAQKQYQILLRGILDLLKKIHNISCVLAKPELVNHDFFYIKELSDTIDIKKHYVLWKQERHLFQNKQAISFCDYPFLFDFRAKTMLLQCEAQLSMNDAVIQAFQHNIQTLFFDASDPVNPLLSLHVNRNSIVQNTIGQLDKYKDEDLKKPLHVYFINEEGLDAGGVKKEFFLLLTKEILDPKYGMFTYYEETHTIWFSEHGLEDDHMYRLIGTLCGLAIYNFIIIDLPFPLALYKKLLNKGKIDIDDLKSLSPIIHRSLQELLIYKEDDIEETFCFTFEIVRESFGERRHIELKPNGANIMVNQSNKQEFVDLYIDYIFNKSVDKQFRAFNDGFRRVFPSQPLELFYPDELMSFVVGNTNYDWNDFQKKTEYKEEYHANHPVIKWFWEVFHKMTVDEKKKFLQFLTGTTRVPVFGWTQ
ncbi:unnamed protein product, partial [Didymodactylos carnosus]